MVGDASKLPAVLKALKKFKGQLKGIAYWGTATPDVVQVSTCVLYCPCTQKVPAAFVDLWQRGGVREGMLLQCILAREAAGIKTNGKDIYLRLPGPIVLL